MHTRLSIHGVMYNFHNKMVALLLFKSDTVGKILCGHWDLYSGPFDSHLRARALPSLKDLHLLDPSLCPFLKPELCELISSVVQLSSMFRTHLKVSSWRPQAGGYEVLVLVDTLKNWSIGPVWSFRSLGQQRRTFARFFCAKPNCHSSKCIRVHFFVRCWCFFQADKLAVCRIGKQMTNGHNRSKQHGSMLFVAAFWGLLRMQSKSCYF